MKSLSRVQPLVTPWTAAYQAPPSMGVPRQEYWSGLPFPSPVHESEKWKWSRSVVSNPWWPHGLQLTRLLHPWEFPGKSTGVGCHFLLQKRKLEVDRWHTELSRWHYLSVKLVFVVNRAVFFKGNTPKYQNFNDKGAIEIITPRKYVASEIILTINWKEVKKCFMNDSVSPAMCMTF